jgi:hypothetical protein
MGNLLVNIIMLPIAILGVIDEVVLSKNLCICRMLREHPMSSTLLSILLWVWILLILK